ncbi:MAG: 3-phosphoshikimate 1-carboxyvinyltransferase, partial [Actinobacteria bacterium]|nr:3-phosphoshikimate 1-carboxyvinyltransferase [Actinomycetota bacterium]
MTENGREQLIQVPGSKSIANRALICAALANSSSTITNCAPGDDTQAMLEALNILGVATVQDGTTVRVNSQINLEDKRPLELQTRLAGTTSRFLTALA